ncbi:Uncharacterised protein [Mycobacteroides abscessus subsp. massiliense]|nr:Uncharacterised protein [Mycobacteroides abscessus subsp. massiliense]SKJ39759.1 Uncharacterised protein [Mycobacteroides abscessus subsp. massiliense]SKR74050.1 Uncharacterised protein [Mycobacteroides abscessus subsp. massiliense]SKS39243.1 Uncharacterised protein [Mycobacteroides abscessus subsp. massiliense]SKS90514.1 Uncharacterised protein [Mycobacteroides abscessus subsp. massiliense]
MALDGRGQLGMYNDYDQASLWAGLVRELVAAVELLDGTPKDVELEGWEFLKAANLDPCPRCGEPFSPGQWVVADGPVVAHHYCPTLGVGHD